MDKSAQKSPSLGIAHSLALSMLLALGTLQMAEPSAAVPPITYNDQVCDLPTGAGTSANPYIISTADQLWEATDCTRVAGSQAYLELANDIDVSVATNAPTNSPIGFSTSDLVYTFSGILDGKGYQISGISMSRADGVGLFGYLNGATLKNFSLSGIFFTSTTNGAMSHGAGSLAVRSVRSVTITSITNSADVSGFESVGGLIGNHESASSTRLTIQDSVNQGDVVAVSSRSGGLVGYVDQDLTILNSENTGIISGSDYVGGLVGYLRDPSIITRAVNSGDVFGLRYVGGIIGYQSLQSQINDSRNTGTISGGDAVGGLLGISFGTTIGNSYNSSPVFSANSGSRCGQAGGLIGVLFGFSGTSRISESFNVGSVSGCYLIGGIIGYWHGSGTTRLSIVNVYNVGTVSTVNSEAGGLIGATGASSDIVNAYNYGIVSRSGTGPNLIDSLVGGNQGQMVSSSYVTVTSRLASASTKTQPQMQVAETYVGWDFDSTWGFGLCSENNGLPVLKFAQDLESYDSDGCFQTRHVSNRTWENWHSSSPHLVMAFSATPGEAFSVTIPISGVTAGGSVKIQDDEFYQITTSAIALADNLTVTLDAASVSSSTIHVQIEGTNVATTLGTNPNPDSWNSSLKGILSWGNLGLVNISKAIFGASVTGVPNALPPGVSDLSEFFFSQSVFNSDISGWDVSDVTQMPGMFRGATIFNQDITSWDVSSVVNMGYMFVDANEFNQPIGSWDVRNVTNFNLMFHRAPKFNQPLAAWDVTNGLNLSSMFEGATSFNQPLRNWTVSNVINFDYIFRDATSFDQPLDWRPESATSLLDMFVDSAMTCRNYESFLMSAQPALLSGATGTIGGGKYTADALEIRAAIEAKGWTVSDSPCVDFPSLSQRSFAASVGANITFTQSYSGAAATFSITPSLPSGLNLNASDGVISGTLSEAFSGAFLVVATNREGSSSATISITISAPPQQDQVSQGETSVRSIKIPKFHNLNRVEVESNATTSVRIFGEDFQLIRSLQLINRNLTFSIISNDEMVIVFRPTPAGIYDLRLELTSGVMSVGSAFEFRTPKPLKLFSTSQLVLSANRFSSKISDGATKVISNWKPEGRVVTCIAYNDRPGIEPRRKALSRAKWACAAYSGILPTRVEVFRGSIKLANSVKLKTK